MVRGERKSRWQFVAALELLQRPKGLLEDLMSDSSDTRKEQEGKGRDRSDRDGCPAF